MSASETGNDTTTSSKDEEAAETATEKPSVAKDVTGGDEAAIMDETKSRKTKIFVAVLCLILILMVVLPTVIIKTEDNREARRTEFAIVDEDRELLYVAAGDGHSCAIYADDDSVVCWGNSVSVLPDIQAVQVAVGDQVTCVILKEDNSVRCWGEGHSSDTIQPPQDIGPVASLSVAGTHACAIQEDNEINSNSTNLQCWGYNSWTSGPLLPPVDVGRVKSVFLSDRTLTKQMCAIREEDDHVRCWSLRSKGYGDTEPTYHDSVAIVPPGLGPVSSVVVTRYVNCAVRKTDGQIWCWANEVERTYGGSYERIDVPLDGNFVDIAATKDVACGVQEDGGLVCFGLHDPLGIRNFRKLDVEKVDTIDGGTSHFCAIRLQDNLGVCWSTNNPDSRPLGPGHLAPIGNFEPVVARNVVAGRSRTCAVLFDGSLDCWGGSVPGTWYKQNITQIAIGDSNVCRVSATSGLVDCGYGQDPPDALAIPVKHVAVTNSAVFGACAIPESDAEDLFCWGQGNLTVTPPDNLKSLRYESLHFSTYHFCGIQAVSRELVCWLDQEDRRFNFPVEPPAELGPVQDVALGTFYTCAVTANGEMVCWGNGDRDDTANSLSPPEGVLFLAVAATEYETCGITTDNFIQCWGRPFSGVMYPPSNIGRVKSITGGDDHFCAVKLENDEVTCWGSNKNGELAKEYDDYYHY